MTATKRIMREMASLQQQPLQGFQMDSPTASNFLKWSGLLLPTSQPYNLGAFRFEIEFPPEYPFKPPKITLKTRIYHPNVDEKGQVCLSMILPEMWKPATKMVDVLHEFIKVIDEPQIDHALRSDIAEIFIKKPSDFLHTAGEEVKMYSEKRP
ncbi:hypothetical protein SNEBB_005414 [Seison nebaliae]|nr:hypothetical protein SNEBB_005414 [Seison nebaliae]